MKPTNKTHRLTLVEIVIAAVILTLAATAAAVRADEKHHQKSEAVLASAWCDEAGGATEYRLPDRTRVDCLLDDYAVEMDWSHKWAECVGQAQYYGAMTNRRPACVLIKKRATSQALFDAHNRRAVVAADRYTLIICITTTGASIACRQKPTP